MKRLAILAFLAAGCAQPQGQIPQLMQDAPRTEEDVRRIVAEIRGELGEGFIIDQVEGVFFLAADGGLDEFNRCRATLERMHRFLQRDFFRKKPARPIRVYCFKDADGYDRYCRETYHQPPSTPFGFYLPGERKMVMNIATGTGTLAHEIVHPLLAEDFPSVPAWFNEGFASLFEQSRQTVDGDMEGLVNWRLKGLREAMREGRAVSLSALLRTSTREFYDESRGVHYATARYLCQWLQHQKQLRDFYREFRGSAEKDPTGRTALEAVTRRPLEEIDLEWRAWVEALK